MARFPKDRLVDFHKLRSVLAQTKETENPLYQTVSGLIDKLGDYQKITNDAIAGGTGGEPGPAGPTGPVGPQGPPGSTGPGVAAGGTSGQVLTKVDATNYNTFWSTPISGGAPGPHHTTHEPGGTDAMAVDAAPTVGSLRTLGTGANQAAAGNDVRLTNSRFPTPHNFTHEEGGADELNILDLGGYTGSPNAFLAANKTFSTVPPVAPLPHHTTHEQGGSDAITNVAWVNAANTFTLGPQIINYNSPQIGLNDTGQSANLRLFDIVNYAQTLNFRALNDLGDTVLSTPIRAFRDGNVAIGKDITEKGRTTALGHWNVADCVSYCALPLGGPFKWSLVGKTLTLSLYGAGIIGAGNSVVHFNMPPGITIASETIGIVPFFPAGAPFWMPALFYAGANVTSFDIYPTSGGTIAAGQLYVAVNITMSIT